MIKRKISILYPVFILILLYFGVRTLINSREAPPGPKENPTHELSLFEKDRALKEKIQGENDRYNTNFYKKTELAESYGLIQRTLDKHFVDDPVPSRRVYRGEGEILYYAIPEKGINDRAVEHVANLKDHLDQKNIPLLFVIAPNKHDENSPNFPQGALDYSNANLKDLVHQLEGRGVDVLNLQDQFKKDGLHETAAFYKTDTHWKNETAFWGYTKLANELMNTRNYPLEYYSETGNLSAYQEENYPDAYIGSMGKRVGKEYVQKKDDYTLYVPKFPTHLTFERFDEDLNLAGRGEGSFEEVFIDRSVLKDSDPYADRYTTMMGYGFPYESITNHMVKNDTKVLLIKDSFAMPLAAYFSANVKTIYLLDTRVENIRNNLTSLIQDANPDAVIFLCSSTSLYYFPEMFDF